MRLAEKIQELPAQKVAGLLEHQLAQGRIQPVLGLFPEIFQRFPEHRAELEAVHQRALAKEKMLARAQAAPAEMQAGQTNCQGCGAVLHRTRGDARAIACNYCGTRFEVSDPEGTATKIYDPERYPPRSFLRPGMVGRIGSQSYQVSGRMVWSGRCREWDGEDDQWEVTAWEYEEWMLVSADRKFVYLCHDAEGLELANEFTPSRPHMPAAEDREMTLEQGARPIDVDEHGDYELVYAEGEFGWVPEPGERLRSAEYSKGRWTYSAEARLDADTGRTTEVEFFRARGLELREFLQAFDRERELTELDRRQRVRWQKLRWMLGCLAVAAAIAVLGLVMASGGRTVHSESLSLDQIPADGGRVLGPIVLQAVGRPHRLEVSVQIPDNRWTWVGAELLDGEQNSINAMDGDFWRESGYDDEGRWSERDTLERKHFVLDTAGSYFVRLQLEQGTAERGTVYVQVSENTVLSRYYLICAAIAAVLALLLIPFRRNQDLIAGLGERG